MIKRLINQLLTPLTILFRKSLLEGKFPDKWKTAHVIPIYKGAGTKDSPENYRPISLTSVVGKILEKFLYPQLEKYFDINGFIKNNQFGFKKGRSVCLQLLSFKNYLEKCLENNEPVDVLYLDFKKAFDTVPHKKLILKLESCGVGGKVLQFIESFLINRIQYVKIQSNLSDSVKVLSGVPQGSVLGPLLFSFYVSDLAAAVKNSFILFFADDTKIFLKITQNGNLKIQNDLDSVIAWSEKWQIDLNFVKSKCLHFGKGNPKFIYNLN